MSWYSPRTLLLQYFSSFLKFKFVFFSAKKDQKSIVLNIEKHYFNALTIYDTSFYPEEFLYDLNVVSCYTNDAFSWMIGQFIKHALRLNEKTRDIISEKTAYLKEIKNLIG